jgi:hypothetical protein
MKTKILLPIMLIIVLTMICCSAPNQKSNPEKYQFRWRYQAQSGQWCQWDTVETNNSNSQSFPLFTGSQAGELKFFIQPSQKENYSAVISWSNSLHSLKSSDDFVNKFQRSQVNLKVQYENEVANPEKFDLEVERIK